MKTTDTDMDELIEAGLLAAHRESLEKAAPLKVAAEAARESWQAQVELCESMSWRNNSIEAIEAADAKRQALFDAYRSAGAAHYAAVEQYRRDAARAFIRREFLDKLAA